MADQSHRFYPSEENFEGVERSEESSGAQASVEQCHYAIARVPEHSEHLELALQDLH